MADSVLIFPPSSNNFSLSLLKKIIALDKEFPFPWTIEDWTDFLNNETKYLFVILEKKVLLGFCLFNFLDIFDPIHLLKIHIANSHRGQGRATALLMSAFKEFNNISNTYKIILEVQENNPVAHALYEKLSFRIIHSIKGFYSNNDTAFVMEYDSSRSLTKF